MATTNTKKIIGGGNGDRVRSVRTVLRTADADGHAAAEPGASPEPNSLLDNPFTRTRLKLGRTQVEQAAACGVAPSTVSMWEARRYLPKIAHPSFKLIAEAYGWTETGLEAIVLRMSRELRDGVRKRPPKAPPAKKAKQEPTDKTDKPAPDVPGPMKIEDVLRHK